VAPTDQLPVVRYDRKAEERSVDLLRWGLVPYWAKDLNVGFANINAKAEGIETRPAFREALQRRRCLVPVDSFYEWKKAGTGKQPYAIALANESLMALAGLWENWRSPAGEWVRSFAIITTTPNELCAELHNRMPVVLKPETWRVWLGEESADVSALKALLAPFPSEEMTCWPVSARVGNVKNNDATLIERIAA
jgi:putative SOS response-associated peptidase YedK